MPVEFAVADSAPKDADRPVAPPSAPAVNGRGVASAPVESSRPPTAAAPVQAPAIVARKAEPGGLNPTFTFASFVAGKANQLARAAGIQVSEHPTSYTP